MRVVKMLFTIESSVGDVVFVIGRGAESRESAAASTKLITKFIHCSKTKICEPSEDLRCSVGDKGPKNGDVLWHQVIGGNVQRRSDNYGGSA